MSVDDPQQASLLWLVIVGSLAAFIYGFGTGSNDVANAFGTSVGAKTLTLRQAVIIAAVFEFTGAMVLGRVSTSVIAGGIADSSYFAKEPEILAYGMVCAMTVSALWQIYASYLEMNVSSTHSIVGSIIGFGLVYGGNDAVLWQRPDPTSFPPVKGVVPIIVSWFFAPLFSAVSAAALFFFVRTAVLRRSNAYEMAFWLLPMFVSITVWVCVYFIFSKGAKKALSSSNWSDKKSAWVAALVAVGSGVLVVFVLLPILRRRSNYKFGKEQTAKERQHSDDENEKEAVVTVKVKDMEISLAQAAAWSWKQIIRDVMKVVTHGTSVDIYAVTEEDAAVRAIHVNAEVFDVKAEFAFQYLQVFSAIAVEFAHGAGEVGYMAGPLTAVWSVYTEGKVPNSLVAPAWAVLISALGLIAGLAMYGYNVTRAMGVKLCKLSPARGFCAELATAFVIMIASQAVHMSATLCRALLQYGLPTSSSQCITGGIIGVGLMEGRMGVNWTMLGYQFLSWIATLIVCGLCTAGLFAQGIAAPNKQQGRAINYYEDQVTLVASAMFTNYRNTLLSYQAASEAGVIPRLSPETVNAYNKALQEAMSAAASVRAGGTVSEKVVMSYLHMALSLYQSDTVLTLGQVAVYPNATQCNSNSTPDIQAGTKVNCTAPNLLPPGIKPTWPPPCS